MTDQTQPEDTIPYHWEQDEPIESPKPDEGLMVVTDLARLTTAYYLQLTAQGMVPDVVKTLTRDYALLTLQTYYGLKGLELPPPAV